MLGEMLRSARASTCCTFLQGAQGVQDTVAGRTQLTTQGIPAIARSSSAVSFARWRDLAPPLPELPDVPTFSETLPGFAFNGWFAVVAPTGAPRQAIQRMNLEFNRILLDGEIEPKLRALGIYTEGTDRPRRSTRS